MVAFSDVRKAAFPSMPAESETFQRSSRDHGELRARLEAWLALRLNDARVTALESPESSGMSSETLLFEAEWADDDGPHGSPFVARIEPDPADVPVFPEYDLEKQFRVMRVVGERSSVPVPRVCWLEVDRTPLGARFFVMERIRGRVPPDVMPYNLGSWLMDASPAEQRALQDSTVDVLAELHRIDADHPDLTLLQSPGAHASALRRHIAGQRQYYEWARGDGRHRLIESAFDWIERNLPAAESPAVVSWGDSRIGNVLYDGFKPVGILDWEMVALGPREIDLAWLVFMHLFFEDIARQLDHPGMPHFMTLDDVCERYAVSAGYEPRDMEFYLVYAALRHAIIMTRIHARRVHFGEAEWGEDVDAVIPHRGLLERMMAGK